MAAWRVERVATTTCCRGAEKAHEVIREGFDRDDSLARLLLCVGAARQFAND